MQQLYDSSALKNPINVSINSDLIKKAKAMDINMSNALEQKLIELIKQKLASDWLESNKSAIADYNRHLEQIGGFSEGLRGI